MIFLLTLAAFGGQGYVGYSLDGTLTPESARAITERCKVPKHWLRVRRDGSVRLRPPSGARYADVDCVLSQLNGTDGPGFVGNERYRPEPVEKSE